MALNLGYFLMIINLQMHLSMSSYNFESEKSFDIFFRFTISEQQIFDNLLLFNYLHKHLKIYQYG